MPSDIMLDSEYTSPLDIPYIQTLIFSLSSLGAWPYKELGGEKWWSKYRNNKAMFILLTVALTSSLIFLRNSIASLTFFDLGRMLLNILLCCVAMQRMTMIWTKLYVNTSKDFFENVQLFHYRYNNEYSMKIYNDVNKISNIVSHLIHVELYFGLLFFNVSSLYISYRRGMFSTPKPENATYEQGCYYYVPFNYDTEFNGFLAVYIFNCFITFDIAGTICAVDLYIFVIVFNLWGHIKILKHNLRSFPRPESENVSTSSMNPPWYNEEESDTITTLLVESIEHYKIIKSFMAEVSMAFGSTMCFYYLFHQISGCILLVEMTQMNADAFGKYGILTFTSFQQLIQMSTIFELISSQSETIKDAVYDVPWECMNNKNRKIVLIYLCNVQEPMQLKALGLLPVGVQTMASILKTSFSYFMLLRTVSATEK